jgi:hypothetical protein
VLARESPVCALRVSCALIRRYLRSLTRIHGMSRIAEAAVHGGAVGAVRYTGRRAGR